METPLVFFQLNHLHTIRIIWLLIAKCPRKPSGIFFRWNQFYLISFLQNIWIHLLYGTFCMDQNYIDKNSFVQTYANITKGKCRYEICSYTTFSIFKMKRSKSQFVFFYSFQFFHHRLLYIHCDWFTDESPLIRLQACCNIMSTWKVETNRSVHSTA